MGSYKLTERSVMLRPGALLAGGGDMSEAGGVDAEAGSGAAGGGGGHVTLWGEGGLEVLRLHCNDISAVGASHLAAMLPRSRVAVLDLTDNNIACAGAASLAAGGCRQRSAHAHARATPAVC
jgi:hypothetical protein